VDLLETVLVTATALSSSNAIPPCPQPSLGPRREDTASTVKPHGIIRKITTRTVKATAMADRIASLQHSLLVLLSLVTRTISGTVNPDTDNEAASQVRESAND
jgi:hypothetical protein